MIAAGGREIDRAQTLASVAVVLETYAAAYSSIAKDMRRRIGAHLMMASRERGRNMPTHPLMHRLRAASSTRDLLIVTGATDPTRRLDGWRA